MKLRIKFRRIGNEWMSTVCKGRGIGSGIHSRIGGFWWAVGLFASVTTWKHYIKHKGKR